MTPLQQRLVLFLIGCLGARLGLVYLASSVSPQNLRIMGAAAACVSLGFAAIYANGWRKTGVETGGAPIWWNWLRPFHAATYALFAYYAWTGAQGAAWKVLLADVIVGLLAFAHFHYTSRAPS
jgi:ABC-type xylose transport system permease subunit